MQSGRWNLVKSGSVGSADYSPDGTRIVYIKSTDGNTARNLCITDADANNESCEPFADDGIVRWRPAVDPALLPTSTPEAVETPTLSPTAITLTVTAVDQILGQVGSPFVGLNIALRE